MSIPIYIKTFTILKNVSFIESNSKHILTLNRIQDIYFIESCIRGEY